MRRDMPRAKKSENEGHVMRRSQALVSLRACACRGCSRCDLLVVHCWLVEVVRERLCEYKGVSAVPCTSPSARIHGVLTSVSPMKKRQTCSFFDGELQHAALAAPHRHRLCCPSHAWSIYRGYTCARALTLNGNCIPERDLTIAIYIYMYL